MFVAANLHAILKAHGFVVEAAGLQVYGQVGHAREQVGILQSFGAQVHWRQPVENEYGGVVLNNRVVDSENEHAETQCLKHVAMLCPQGVELAACLFREVHIFLQLCRRLQFRLRCCSLSDSLENPPASIQTAELSRIRELRLRLPEKKNAAWFERIVQSRQDLLLKFGIEVDQDIPAQKKVHMGDWRILTKVALPEN